MAEQESLDWTSSRLCLDFANTADWHDSDDPEEKLGSYTNLVSWSREAHILTERQVRQLLDEAERRPEEAASTLEQAIALRETIFRIFSAVAEGTPVAELDLEALNAALSPALSRLRVTPSEKGYGWKWAAEGDELDRMLWLVARSAGELLTSDERSRVRKCAGYPCGWLFLDTSKNQSRRWCDMKSCGNRAKARRHYARIRAGTRAP